MTKSLIIVLLIGINILGCAGTTAVQRQHHLLSKDSSTVSVFFLRPSEGMMGVRGKPIGINLDGENLLSLSIGQYTSLNLTPGKYDMEVTGWTIEGPMNEMVETSRGFLLDLTNANSVYLLFTLEEISFWKAFGQNLAAKADTLAHKFGQLIYPDTINVPVGKYVTLQLINDKSPSEYKPEPGIGYNVESVSRWKAIEVASELEPVEGAQSLSIRK